MIAEDLHTITDDKNVPVIGYGPASHMADELPGHRPEDFLPGAQSLICFSIPVPRQVYQAPNYSPELVWRSQNLLYRRLDTLSLRFASLLEGRGKKRCLSMAISPWMSMKELKWWVSSTKSAWAK
jgi:hypothetical protein